MRKHILQKILLKLSSTISQFVPFLPIIITLLILMYIYITKNIIFCSEVTNSNLDSFFLRGYSTRIDIIKDVAIVCDDPETLRYLLLELQQMQAFHHAEMASDNPFVDSLPPMPLNNQHVFSYKLLLQNLFLFIILSIFGFCWFKVPLILYPIIYYKQQILTLLSLMEQDPDLYLELMADFYEQLVEEGIIFD